MLTTTSQRKKKQKRLLNKTKPKSLSEIFPKGFFVSLTVRNQKCRIKKDCIPKHLRFQRLTALHIQGCFSFRHFLHYKHR